MMSDHGLSLGKRWVSLLVHWPTYAWLLYTLCATILDSLWSLLIRFGAVETEKRQSLEIFPLATSILDN